MSSSFEQLPTEILRRIVVSEVETSHAIVQDQDGCLRYKLNPLLLLTSKTVYGKCIERWRCNRLVRITYRGDARYRPTAFVPIAANNAYRILTMSRELVRTAFTADLNVSNELYGDESNSIIPTENVCVLTVDAVCTWLAILGCQQFAEHAYHEKPPAFRLDLIVHDSSKISSPTGGDLYQAIALILPNINVNAVEDRGGEMAVRQNRIGPARLHAMIICSSFYSAWISSSQIHDQVLSALRNREAQLDYCTCVCKQLIGINRLVPSSFMTRLLPSEESLITQLSCAALLNWTYEYHRSVRDEGSLTALKESWQGEEASSCVIEGCPCLLWTGLNLGVGQTIPRSDAARHGIHLTPWLEVHRWTIAIHCRRRLAEGDYDGLVDARDQMLEVKACLQPEELKRSFAQDLESFTIAATMGIRGLANCRGMAMVDEDDESQVDVLWDSLTLEKERAGKSVEWRVQECTLVLEAAKRISSQVVVGADIIPAQSMVFRILKKTQ